MNYSTTEGSVRVDFFRPTGGWYTTVEVDMTEYYLTVNIRNAIIKATKEVVREGYNGMTLVCLEPFHQFSHPIMIPNWDSYQTI